MGEICVIIPYFGKFRNSFELFINSCRYNGDITWLIFSDNSKPDELPNNIIWNECTLNDVKLLAEEKLKMSVRLQRPYKLCDLKPLYGKIFEDYISNFAYWGYGDIDLIYGDLISFLAKIRYQNYDKINRTGHFCLLKNNERCVNAYRVNTNDTIDIAKVLQDGDSNYGFDERDYNKKCEKIGLRIFDGIFAADIDHAFERMRCVDKKTLRFYCDMKVNAAPKNYRLQMFIHKDGKIFRFYIDMRNRLKYDEFAYLHFRREVPILFSVAQCDNYIISRQGFINLDNLNIESHPNKLIHSYNMQEELVVEELKWIYRFIRYGKR